MLNSLVTIVATPRKCPGRDCPSAISSNPCYFYRRDETREMVSSSTLCIPKDSVAMYVPINTHSPSGLHRLHDLVRTWNLDPVQTNDPASRRKSVSTRDIASLQ